MPQSMNLPFHQHPDAPQVKHLYHKLAGEGHQLLIVGGAVRDWILGVQPKDLDLVTTATPDELERIFLQTVPVGKSFGVMIVVYDRKSFEVATLRTEGRYLDGRHPEKVAWGTVDQDVHRRDFTINSIYYDPFKGVIYDLVGGLQDLRDRRLRSVGKSQTRFDEDHLRVLRAYRFRAQTGFFFDPELKEALKHSTPLLRTVSGERRREELSRLFTAPDREVVIPDLLANEVLPTLFPGLKFSLSTYQKWHGEPPWGLAELFRWICQEQNLSAEQWKKISEDLRLSRDERKGLEDLLTPWRALGDLLNMSLAEFVQKLWNPSFRAGLEQYLTEIPFEHPLRQRSEEAVAICKRWGPKPPEPWFKASDFPDLKGPELGAKLKKMYEDQLCSQASDRDEFLRWRKHQN